MSGFIVINPGIQSTIQDIGRRGYGAIGVTQAGAMDEHASHWCNTLLDNPFGTNVVEIAFGGLKLKALETTHIVVTGAKVSLSIDGRAIKMWKTHKIHDGETLDIGFATQGQRVYLGVKGGFDISPSFGSCALSVKEGIGGLNGMPLKKDDRLPFSHNKLHESRGLLMKHEPDYAKPLVMRLVPGYQWEMFSESERQKFFENTYEVTPQSDRMGFRLTGEKIQASQGGIISEPIAYGSVQIPSHGEPIVLMKERQTIGGYPKIGTVIPVDCFKLAQRIQGAKVSFREVSFEKGRKITQDFYRFFQ